MSMDNLSSLGVIQPSPENSDERGMRLKSELDSNSGQGSEHESESEEETDIESDDELESKKAQEDLEVYMTWESKPIEYLQERYDDDPFPCCFVCKNFSYKNPAMLKKEEDSKKAVAEYLDRTRDVSPFDAIPVPPMANVPSNNFPGPIPLTQNNRPHYIQLSKLALDYYNHDNQGLNYVFEDIVKVNRQPIPVGTRYITFIAKPKHSEEHATTTFQAQVWERLTLPGPPVVKSAPLKTTNIHTHYGNHVQCMAST